MSKLEELIKQHCPNGVEYKTLGEICEIHKGVQFNKSNMNDEGTYPVINGGINPSGYIEQYNENENTITISQGGASAGYVNWLTKKFWAGAHCYIVKPLNEKKLSNRYLFHFIKNNEPDLQQCQYGAGIPALGKSTIESLSIPLPPLPVQEEIVRILDAFTKLTAELTAELTARRKQYEYYRDALLSFDKVNTPPHLYKYKVKWVTLGEIAEICVGGDIPKGRFSKEKTDCFNIPIYSNGVGKNALYGYTDKAKIQSNCITIAARGTIGYCSLRKEPFYPIVRLICAIPHNDVNVSYLYYVIQTLKFSTPKSGIPQLTVPMLNDYRLPLPPLSEQERIVAILDRFDSLCNDLTQGLPAEIAARKKQYEYYRDKLLSFTPA